MRERAATGQKYFDGDPLTSPDVIPCPFCRSKWAEIVADCSTGEREGYAVCCWSKTCCCIGPIRVRRNDSVKAWNKRNNYISEKP